MAGSYFLNPGRQQTNIPTWPLSKQTKVRILNEAPAPGFVAMQAGVSFPELHSIPAVTEQEYERDFGSALLTLSNVGGVPLVARTD
jgi:hypothetical protein